MASILNVDQINNAAGTSAVTIDATTGKPSFPNGATLPAGSVVQVVRVDPTAAWPSRFSTTSTSFLKTPHVITITPKYSNSLIVIQGTFSCASASNDYWYYDLRRNVSGGTTTSFGDTTNGVMPGGGLGGWHTSSMQYVDAPNTTSQITYEVWLRSNGGNTVYVGWTTAYTAHNGVFLHAMEIAQ